MLKREMHVLGIADSWKKQTQETPQMTVRQQHITKRPGSVENEPGVVFIVVP
jgi:hypothetical protein